MQGDGFFALAYSILETPRCNCSRVSKSWTDCGAPLFVCLFFFFFGLFCVEDKDREDDDDDDDDDDVDEDEVRVSSQALRLIPT